MENTLLITGHGPSIQWLCEKLCINDSQLVIDNKYYRACVKIRHEFTDACAIFIVFDSTDSASIAQAKVLSQDFGDAELALCVGVGENVLDLNLNLEMEVIYLSRTTMLESTVHPHVSLLEPETSGMCRLWDALHTTPWPVIDRVLNEVEATESNISVVDHSSLGPQELDLESMIKEMRSIRSMVDDKERRDRAGETALRYWKDFFDSESDDH